MKETQDATTNVERKKRRKKEKVPKKLVADAVVELALSKEDLPVGAVFSSFEEYWVQELEIHAKTTCYKRARYKLPDGSYVSANLPNDIKGHFGAGLRQYVVNQYHVNNVTQDKIEQDLKSYGISISAGTIDAILDEAARVLEPEHDGILEALKETATTVGTDDTTGRHNTQSHVHSVIQNDLCTYIKSAPGKSRKHYLQVWQGKELLYAINGVALQYATDNIKKAGIVDTLREHTGKHFRSEQEWIAFLENNNINPITTGKSVLRSLDEAALFGGLIEQGVSPDLICVSDNAGQFKKMFHQALCWVHFERSVSRLVPANDAEHQEIKQLISQIWSFYHELAAFKMAPTDNDKVRLEAAFDTIFSQIVTGQQLLEALYQFRRHKKELLRVLESPAVALHNNASERDIRPLVTKRKISGPTRSSTGYRARYIFASVTKTCQKLGIAPALFIREKLRSSSPTLLLRDAIKARSSALAAAP